MLHVSLVRYVQLDSLKVGAGTVRVTLERDCIELPEKQQTSTYDSIHDTSAASRTNNNDCDASGDTGTAVMEDRDGCSQLSKLSVNDRDASDVVTGNVTSASSSSSSPQRNVKRRSTVPKGFVGTVSLCISSQLVSPENRNLAQHDVFSVSTFLHK